MFFVPSKIAFALIQPSSLAALGLALGLALAAFASRRRLGLRVAGCGLALLLAGGLLPLGNLLLLPLEERFPIVREPPPAATVAAIVLLGGFEDGWVGSGRGRLGLNEAAERLTEGLLLARRLPSADVVFSGGVGSLLVDDASAAALIAGFLTEAGIARERLVVESRSRNTHENALYTRELIKPAPGQRVVLVTSAYHMPRAVGVFRTAGFDVIPYPVDHRLRSADDLLRANDSISAGLARLDLAAKEWIGLVAYRLSGRTKSLLPAP